MDDESRWRTQEYFWATVAKTCAGSPAIFCYDLVNEPAAIWLSWVDLFRELGAKMTK